MPATFLQGEYSRISLGSVNLSPGLDVFYHVKKWTIHYKRARLDVSNTEGNAGDSTQPDTLSPGYACGVRGLYMAEVTIEEATFDTDMNLFITPILIKNSTYLRLKIFPLRGFDYHYFPSLQIEEVSHEGEVGGLQPVSFKGTHDGIYSDVHVT